MAFTWKKAQTIIASLTGLIVLAGAGYTAYNHFTPKSEHVALANEVHTEYAKQDDLLAVNKNIQQSNYDFWIYRTESEIDRLYDRLRDVEDEVERQKILDRIEKKNADIQRWREKLDELRSE